MTKFFYLFILIVASYTVRGQNTHQGEIYGYLTDSNGVRLAKTKIELQKEGRVILKTYTDTLGYYSFNFLSPGLYNILIKPEGKQLMITDAVRLLSEEPTRYIIVYRASDIELSTYEKKIKRHKYVKPPPPPPCVGCISVVVDPKTTHLGMDLKSYVNMGPSFNSTKSGLSSGGNRVTGNLQMLNGRRINSDGVILSTLDQMELTTGGISARYGDLSGGLISYITQAPTYFRSGSLQYLTSTGLDGRNYNHIEGVFKGPLIKDSTRLILGGVFAANYIYTKDINPTAAGFPSLKKDVSKQINTHPYIDKGNGLEQAATSLTSDDWEVMKWNAGKGKNTANIFGALEWSPNKKITINGELTYMNTRSRQVSFYNSIFNAERAALVNNNQLTASLRYNQILVSNEVGKSSNIKNGWVSFRLDYNSQWSETSDEIHGRNFFDYGYIGKFETKHRTNYEYRKLNSPKSFQTKTPDGKRDTVIMMDSYFEQTGDSSTGLIFTASGKNNVRSNYTQDVMNYYGSSIRNSSDLAAKGGLLNGDQPVSVSSLFAAQGTPVSGYAKSNVDLFSIGAESGIKIVGKGNSFHDILFGIQYEQRTYRSYNLNANNLWGLMRNLAHQSDPAMDINHPIVVYDDQGNLMDTVKYNKTVDASSRNHFTEAIRARLMANKEKDEYGNEYNLNSIITPDRLDPNLFRLEDFSADELLNGGKSSLVNYYGYDYLGNKQRKRSSAEDFLNSDKRSIGAFKPIYTAFYIQDRFNLRDFSFQAGLRVENYDANQLVLKDPYTLFPAKSVREVRSERSDLSRQLLPGMSDDATVYVNDVSNPTTITGYRINKNNNQAAWFNKNGAAVTNPEELAHLTSNGRIAPYLVNPAKQTVTASSFKDYQSVWNILPRLWFKFPITSDAFFFAHYDVYAQRPPEGVIATIDDYYFLPQRSSQVINNPALKPVKRTDYELGLRQKLGKYSLLSFIANYSEVRNLIQVTRFNQAYPVSYTSFGNLDFSTIKSMRLEYTNSGKNIGMMGSYVMQFADGTGSNALSAASLVGSGQPNLRNVYPLDYDLRHVLKLNVEYHFNENEGGLFGKNYIFENSGINVNMQARSGLPYTRIVFPVNTVQEGIANRTMMSGTINGSRMPWNFNLDLYLFKNIRLKTITDSLNPEREMRINSRRLNVFLWVQNVLNIKNVEQVYQYTGSAKDDGYLSSEWGQQALRSQRYAESFTDLYNAKLLSPGNYGIPRMFQLGIKYTY